ncbi:hypothetical protein GWI33_011916 [Rhynchophorus ferrugineus]|uniref:Uncharacterized protein n=1 Tax=Rhynchophorus ferrugineus TaxID=354439 RepID=A0A834IRS1_RHYFE|nr:hypothetical protein GWI33_011916 [Rhynchophorus ferrugineus]
MCRAKWELAHFVSSAHVRSYSSGKKREKFFKNFSSGDKMGFTMSPKRVWKCLSFREAETVLLITPSIKEINQFAKVVGPGG